MKISIPGMGELPLTQGREALEALQTLQAIATVLGCPPKLSGKTLLLKMLYTFVAERRNIQAELTWKFPPWWPAFIVEEGAGAVQAVREERASMISLQTTLPGKMCRWCGGGMTVTGGTSYFWIQAWSCEPGPVNPLAREAMAPRRNLLLLIF